MTVQVPFVQLEMVRGDTPVWELAVTDKNGAPYDISGSTIWMTAKNNIDDTDLAAIFQLSTTTGEITLTTPLSGLAQIIPTAAATSGLTADAQLYYDIQVRTPANRTFTVVKGTLIVSRDVTRA